MKVEYNVYVAYCVERHYIPEEDDPIEREEEWDTVIDYQDTEDHKLDSYPTQEQAEKAGAAFLP